MPTRLGTREVLGPGDPPRRTVKATGREQGRKCPLQTLGQVRGQRRSPDPANGRGGSAGSEGTPLGRGWDPVLQADPPPPPAMRTDRVTRGPTLRSRSPAMPSGNRAAQSRQEGRKDRGGPSAQPGSGNPSPAPLTSGSRLAWPLKIGVGVGKDSGPPGPRQRGIPELSPAGR